MIKKLNILVLCAGNSARSLIDVGLLNHLGATFLNAYSAGSNPTGTPSPIAHVGLQNKGLDTSFSRSKSWAHFAEITSPEMNLILTVCANAADEVCPFWPGKPSLSHGVVQWPAPSDGSESEKRLKFKLCF